MGEGLCPRGGDSSTTMSIQTAALGNEDDIFVGGSFESRVWDGHHFVNVYHVAHFDGKYKYVLCTLLCWPYLWAKLYSFAAKNAVLRFRGHYCTPSSCPVTLLLEHNVLGHIILLYIITKWNVFCLMLCFLL